MDGSELWVISIAVLIGVAPPVVGSLAAYFLNERSKRRQLVEDRRNERLQFERDRKYEKTRESYGYILSSLRRAQFDAAYNRTAVNNPGLKFHPDKVKFKLTDDQIEDYNACLQAMARLHVRDPNFDAQKVLDSLENTSERLKDLRMKMELRLAGHEMRLLHEVYLPFECSLALLTLLGAPVKVTDLSRTLMLDLIGGSPKMNVDMTIAQIQNIMQNHLHEILGTGQTEAAESRGRMRGWIGKFRQRTISQPPSSSS
jgi:hypothetical protein